MTAKIKASSDGLKVTIGNAAEDALEINQTAKTINGINGYSISPPAQTWQDVTASRAVSIDYVNDTGRPITVSINRTSNVNTSLGCEIMVGGIVVAVSLLAAVAGIQTRLNTQAVVPAGATYRVTTISSGAVFVWNELR